MKLLYSTTDRKGARIFTLRGIRLLYSFLLVYGFSVHNVYAQNHLPECTANVPFFNLNLSASPDMSYTTPEVERQPGCCSDGDNYISFYVTLNPNVAMFEVVVAPGYADPGGSGNYNIISGGDLVTAGSCGVQIPGGAPICITGPGPHKIIYSKPGKNKIKYIFRQIPKPLFPADQSTRVGCSLPLHIYGLNNISITSINSSTGNSTPGAYNSLLSCTNCSNPGFSPGLGTPSWIDYKICGTPQAAVCGTYQSCDTVRLYTYSALSLTATPNPASFCQGGGAVLLIASATGGDGNYQYRWLDSGGNVVSNSNLYGANTSGIFTVEVTDGLSTATCPNAFVSVPVNVATTPLVNAGADQISCATNPTVLLQATSTTGSGIWTGGTGAFQPTASSLIASYTPSATEINNGSVTLTFTSTGAGGGCLNSSDQMTIIFSDTVISQPSAGSIACYNGSATISAGQSGGTAPFSYFWSTGSSGNSISVTAGTYLLTVTDQYGCSGTTPVTITQPAPLALNIATTTANSPSCDGTASVAISGGASPYTILWTNGETTTNANSLCEGIVGVTVSDNNGCVITQSSVINNTFCNIFNVTINSSTNVSCHNGNDGSATVGIASGGTAPFTYSWNTIPVQTSATAINLVSGTYSVIVTDNSGCQDVVAVTILQPTVITNTMTHMDVSSIGGNDGSATANPLGGIPGYAYVWSPSGQITQTATNLSSAVGGTTYYVAITDANLCSVTDSVLINQPPCNDFIASVNPTGVSCNGLSNGAASLVLANGNSPFLISWSNGINNSMNISNLTSGTYSVTVTDSRNCSTFQTFSITQPAPLSVSLVPTNVSCNNVNDGTIDLTVSGGTYPYTFSWSISGKPYANHEDLTQLSPGTYSVVVTDANGCSISGSVGIAQPAAITTSYNYTDNPCYGNSLGTIDMMLTGGTAPYTYAWTGPSGFTATTQDLSGLASGLYQMNVTDLHGCSAGPVDVYINQPQVLTAVASMSQQVNCAGGNNGAIVVTSQGGTAPYSYAWTGPSSYSSTFEDISGLTAGTYQVTVTDAHSCTTSASASVTTVLDITPPVITCTTDKSVFTSSSSCTYTVPDLAWNAAATDNCLLSGMSYTLSGATTGSGSSLQGIAFNKGMTAVMWGATDGLGNTDTCTFNVTVTDNINPVITQCGPAIPASVSANAGGCTYTHSGTAWNVTATDNCGVDSIRYNLSGATTGIGTSLDGVIFNLGLTTITWTVYDATGNSATCTATVTVSDNQLPSIVSCGATGTQNVLANPGVCTYIHSGTAWDATATDNCSVAAITYTLSGATTGTGTTLNGVIFNSGTTLVTWRAQDGSGNFTTCTFNVIVGDDQNPIISNCLVIGNQMVNANTGICTYMHNSNSWNATATDNCTVSSVVYTLNGATSGTGTSLNGVQFNLGMTTVTWVATDGAGNTDTCIFTVTVNDTQAPVILSCGAVGNQSVVSDAGQCSYTQTSAAWNASAGDNCSIASIIYVLTGATTGTGTSLVGVAFNRGTTTVTWTAADGSGNTTSCAFNVLVSDNQLPVITSCAGGNQNVVADTGLCTFTQTGTAWDATATDNCSVVSLTYTLTGATTGTGTSLNGVVFNQGITTVTWTATDVANNQATCGYTVSVTDTESPVIVNCPGSVIQNSDAGECGAIVNWVVPSFTDNCGATISGTGIPNTYFPVGVSNVNYTVVDNAGNSASCSFSITVIDAEVPVITCPDTIASCNPLVTYSLPVTSDNCSIASLVQTTGLPSGSTFPVGITINTFVVTDIHGNTSDCSFTVRIYPIPISTTVVNQVSCNGFGDATVDLQITNGTAPYQTNWSNGATTEDLANLSPGTYTVDVADNHGCTTVDAVIITEPQVLGITVTVAHLSCYNANDGSVQTSVSGGTTPYTYNWSGGQQTPDLTNLAAGTVNLTVTDANGCILTHSTTITQPDSLMIQAVINNATCNASNGSIQTQVTGGTTPYVFVWSNGSINQNLNNVQEGPYNVQVTDAHGCQQAYSAVILSESNLIASAVVTNVSCHDGNNGEATIIISNGNHPYTYEWSTGGNGVSENNLTAGTYSVLITDSFGCTATLGITVGEPESLEIDLTLSNYLPGYNISSNGAADGFINTTVSGGTGPYTYLWSTTDTTSYINHLGAGEYLLLVTDGNGCTSTVNVKLMQPNVLEMPQGFSPNEDGDNDYFVVHGIKSYPDNSIVVFNRWGNIVYQRNGYADEWYGDNNSGDPLPDATYFVILKAVVAGEEKVLQGYVDLRRK
nr:HYR domain-containing protein [uncultured Fluviicola sp.]